MWLVGGCFALMGGLLWSILDGVKSDEVAVGLPGHGNSSSVEAEEDRLQGSGFGQEEVKLFRAEVVQATETGTSVSAVRRHRLLRRNPAWFDPKRSPFYDPPIGQTVTLPLFADTEVTARVLDSGVSLSGGCWVRGSLPGHPEGRFLMSLTGDSIAMLVELSPGERYVLNEVSDGLYEVAEVGPEAMPDCAGAVPVFSQGGLVAARLAPGDLDTISEESPVAPGPHVSESSVDLLVVYGSGLETSYPVDAIRAKIELAVLEANDDFARSGAGVRLRLVGLHSVAYAGGTNNSASLEHLQSQTDGHLDDVHQLRDEHGADLVCLIPGADDPWSNGVAFVLSDPGDPYADESGFSIVEYGVLTGINGLAHEIGHNLGCHHDRENAGGEGLFSFSYGYRFEDEGVSRRTIMAYRPGERVSYFSSPDRFYGGLRVPMGVAAGLPGEADNVRSLNRGAFGVSNYRLSKVASNTDAEWINVSTRGVIDAGERNLITGFVIQGDRDRSVLLRGLSPGLFKFGIQDTLNSMRLGLFRGRELLAVNTGWAWGPDWSAIEASGYAPGHAGEPALLVALPAGRYTAVLTADDSTAGTGLIEIHGSGAGKMQAINISSRGVAGHGDEALIGGFVLTGPGTETHPVLIRVLGAGLAAYGVKGVLQDPVATLYNDRGIPLLTNDDWDRGHHAGEIAAAGYAPSVRRESAMLVDLAPGLYTVVVVPYEGEDESGEPGYALIEAFELDPD